MTRSELIIEVTILVREYRYDELGELFQCELDAEKAGCDDE